MPWVLVVDDDRAIRELLRIALEFEGYTVVTFADGRGVVEALTASAEPCAILLDLSMPHMTGWQVCAELMARPAALAAHHLVVMTAEPLTAAECPAPACALLRKPFDLEDAFALLARLLAPPALAPVTPSHLACE